MIIAVSAAEGRAACKPEEGVRVEFMDKNGEWKKSEDPA
jgi:hypothetical protein